MALTISGSSLVFTGTVTISNFTNAAAGVCTLTLTPTGGVGNIPALLQGQPGAPALINTPITVNTLSPGSSATGTLTQTNAGGPGQSSQYNLTLGIPQGAQGVAGTNATIRGASDLSGTAAVGNILTVNAISPTTFVYSAMPFGNVFNTPSASISSVSLTGQASQTMATLAVPAQPYAWYPLVSAQGTVVGTVNTVVNLTAWLNTVNTGNVLGKVSGFAGQGTQLLTMVPSYGALTGSGSPAYGQVAAGVTSNIILVAQQTASTGDSCTISNTTASFTVQMVPI